jgi:hypothetical protein
MKSPLNCIAMYRAEGISSVGLNHSTRDPRRHHCIHALGHHVVDRVRSILKAGAILPVLDELGVDVALELK